MKERIQQLLCMLHDDSISSSEKSFACVEYDILCLWCEYRDTKDEKERDDVLAKIYQISSCINATLAGERIYC